MLPAALGSSVVRPFYNRGVASGPPPMARTALGTAVDDSGAVEQVTISGISIAAGETLLAATVYTGLIDDEFEFAINPGLPAWTTIKSSVAGGRFTIAVGWVDASLAPYSGNLQFVWIAGDLPANVACLAIKVSSLKATAPHDAQALGTGGGTASSTQDSGPTAATAQATEFVWGIIGTDGRASDTVGAWDGPLVAGQSAGTTGTGVEIKEGYYLANAVSTYRARITGATSRRWGARCDTFKGV